MHNKLLLTYPSEIRLKGRLAEASLDRDVVLGACRDVDLWLDQGSKEGVLRVQVAQVRVQVPLNLLLVAQSRIQRRKSPFLH